ncbi:ROK family protein [Desulfurococcus mucosus]|uniref:Glucokinase n=1 Tax=Desulfurococcus mucosus (strain ATCC 35584 / DSM 2162 / JCM 9187 / O7/1) TaxID=765177 RepID=E8R8S8_DESM0|nr:ROK family protein [Desulfurococcus mucosus]ADV64904.1 glucokinase [Desulfurococcus mucosus DSM 2162]
MGQPRYIAVDIGASKTRIALCDGSRILDKVVFSTPRTGDSRTIAEAIVSKTIEKWREELGSIEAVGVASIGPLDLERGRVVKTPNLPFEEIELLEPLSRMLGVKVYVVNDAVAGAWGEKHFGAGRHVRNLLYVTLSTGVGGGVVVDNHLLLGKQGNAHEIGHIVVDYDSDLRCGCGGYGHWEAYAGGGNLPRVALWLLEKNPGLYRGSVLAERLRSGIQVTSVDVFSLYRAGDPLAADVVGHYIRATAAGLASAINVYDPELVIIGGGVFLNNADILLKPVKRRVLKEIVTRPPIIQPTSLGDDVGLYGALAIAVEPPPELLEAQGRSFHQG